MSSFTICLTEIGILERNEFDQPVCRTLVHFANGRRFRKRLGFLSNWWLLQFDRDIIMSMHAKSVACTCSSRGHGTSDYCVYIKFLLLSSFLFKFTRMYIMFLAVFVPILCFPFIHFIHFTRCRDIRFIGLAGASFGRALIVKHPSPSRARLCT